MDAQTRFTERIQDLSERVDKHKESFEPPANPPAEEQAMEILREGAGPTIALFVEARTGRHMVHFPPEPYETLEETMNDWLDLYAACYGTDLNADFTIREAAELLVDTKNIKDVAELLTKVPADQS
ncbi:hypothetical protein [Salinibaculum rarum]|uniref:hypothetical protein n=1 Tax=Salinibaculum rarum TaxID=3058903 RepID=UPI00265DA6F9|nr:hypothetical protein [Salinibaculum sp. KK48]